MPRGPRSVSFPGLATLSIMQMANLTPQRQGTYDDADDVVDLAELSVVINLCLLQCRPECDPLAMNLNYFEARSKFLSAAAPV